MSSTVRASAQPLCPGPAAADSFTATCTVTGAPRIVVTKVCPTAPVKPGDLMEFKGTVRNAGNITLVDVTVVNRTDRELPTPIAVIGLPAGGELPTRVLEDLQKAGAFASWELRGRELVLYWRTLAPRAEQKLTLDLITRVPGETTGPASRAWLYYTSSQKRWAAPLALTVRGR